MSEKTNQKIELYLKSVTEQIRFKKARPMVAKELENHILEEVEFQKQSGLDEEEAVKQAILEMGDPIEVGVSFDKIHKPQVSWSTIFMVGLMSILSILLQMMLEQKGLMLAMAGHHAFYTIVGMILMLGIYYVDYSVWARYADVIGKVFLGVMIVTLPFRMTVNGVSFIRIGSVFISIPLVMYLFVPIFGAILFQYRGQGYNVLWKLALWIGTTIMMVLGTSVIHALILGGILLTLFFISVWKEWYLVNKKHVLAVTGGMMLMSPFFLRHVLSDYYLTRIQAFFQQNPDYVYITNKAISILESAKWFGQSEQGIPESLPGYNNELVLVSLIACFGIVVGCLVVCMLLWLIYKTFHISKQQKNQLGMIVGYGCGIVFFMQVMISVLQCIGVIPIMSVVLPFFSRSGSGNLVSYILVGILLSIYRYQNLPARKIAKSRLKISIRWEEEA